MDSHPGVSRIKVENMDVNTSPSPLPWIVPTSNIKEENMEVDASLSSLFSSVEPASSIKAEKMEVNTSPSSLPWIVPSWNIKQESREADASLSSLISSIEPTSNMNTTSPLPWIFPLEECLDSSRIVRNSQLLDGSSRAKVHLGNSTQSAKNTSITSYDSSSTRVPLIAYTSSIKVENVEVDTSSSSSHPLIEPTDPHRKNSSKVRTSQLLDGPPSKRLKSGSSKNLESMKAGYNTSSSSVSNPNININPGTIGNSASSSTSVRSMKSGDTPSNSRGTQTMNVDPCPDSSHNRNIKITLAASWSGLQALKTCLNRATSHLKIENMSIHGAPSSLSYFPSSAMYPYCGGRSSQTKESAQTFMDANPVNSGIEPAVTTPPKQSSGETRMTKKMMLKEFEILEDDKKSDVLCGACGNNWQKVVTSAHSHFRKIRCGHFLCNQCCKKLSKAGQKCPVCHTFKVFRSDCKICV